MAKVQFAEVTNFSPSSQIPKARDAVFDTLKSDPVMDTADMRVEGDWTYRQMADFIVTREFVDGASLDWESFKQTDFDAVPSGQALPFFEFGDTAADPQSTFGAGDPGIGVTVGNGYYLDGRSGRASALEHQGNSVAVADAGERSVAFNAPGGIDLAQNIVQYGWGYQMSAVGALINNAPVVGNSSTWKIPAYNTRNGPISMLAGYTYSYPAPLGVPLFTTTFDINSPSDQTYTFALRDNSGEVVTSSDLDLTEGGNTARVGWVNAPPSGYVTIDGNGTRYTIEGSEAMPPVL